MRTICMDCGIICKDGDQTEHDSHGLCIACAAVREAGFPHVEDHEREAMRAVSLAEAVQIRLRRRFEAGDLSGAELDDVATALVSAVTMMGLALRRVSK